MARPENHSLVRGHSSRLDARGGTKCGPERDAFGAGEMVLVCERSWEVEVGTISDKAVEGEAERDAAAAPPFQGWGLNWSQLVPSVWDYLGVCTVPSEILSMGACY